MQIKLLISYFCLLIVGGFYIFNDASIIPFIGYALIILAINKLVRHYYHKQLILYFELINIIAGFGLLFFDNFYLVLVMAFILLIGPIIQKKYLENFFIYFTAFLIIIVRIFLQIEQTIGLGLCLSIIAVFGLTISYYRFKRNILKWEEKQIKHSDVIDGEYIEKTTKK